jgi:hypothetical protein
VTISRGRRGIRIFTPDKVQLRENVTRSGHRPLALELAAGLALRRGVRLWDRLHGCLLRFGRMRRTASVGSNFLVVGINPLKPMSTKTPECWASDPNARRGQNRSVV